MQAKQCLTTPLMLQAVVSPTTVAMPSKMNMSLPTPSVLTGSLRNTLHTALAHHHSNSCEFPDMTLESCTQCHRRVAVMTEAYERLHSVMMLGRLVVDPSSQLASTLYPAADSWGQLKALP
jgi:hypothetical protein